jgi:tetratricopeptide (TPR) repeat protein
MGGQPVKLSEEYSERLAKAASVKEVEFLIDDIRNELLKRASTELSELFIRSNIEIKNLDDAEKELNSQLSLYQPENIPVNLLFYKAHIEINKGANDDAITTLESLIDTAQHTMSSSDNRKIKVKALAIKALCLSNMFRMKDSLKIVEEIFSILKPGKDLNIFDNSFEDIFTRERPESNPVDLVNRLREYKKGLELIEKDKNFRDIYKHVTDNILKRDTMLYEAYPTVFEGDREYPFDEPVIIITTKELNPEDKFDKEMEIEKEIDDIFPDNDVMISLKPDNYARRRN